MDREMLPENYIHSSEAPSTKCCKHGLETCFLEDFNSFYRIKKSQVLNANPNYLIGLFLDKFLLFKIHNVLD
jgi:hypothetical protein